MVRRGVWFSLVQPRELPALSQYNLVTPIGRDGDRARFLSKVDEYAARTQSVDLRKVRQLGGGSARNEPRMIAPTDWMRTSATHWSNWNYIAHSEHKRGLIAAST